MAPGITNDPDGVFYTPKTGIRQIDNQVEKLQAEDAARIAASRAKAAAELPTPDARIGGDRYSESV